MKLLLVQYILIVFSLEKINTKKLIFPKNFKFGVATSAYQIEGAWDIDGKTPNIWDHYTHNEPYRIIDNTNGDVACNSYSKIDDDIHNLVTLNVDFYRFSISWTRILPSGFDNQINQAGVDYYNSLINKLLEKNIEPVITIYHWDMPQSLNELGGFTNELFSDWFADYSRVCFKLFGDRVKKWITINEPTIICNYGYGQAGMAPFIKSDYIGRYLCAHNLILSHAKAYDVYNLEFRYKQQGKIGISIESSWFEPFNTEEANVKASERYLQFYVGWFLHPILKDGGYPAIMRERIDENSKREGFRRSRLPDFTKEERTLIKNSTDFVGLNHYTTFLVQNLGNTSSLPSYINDVGIIRSQKPEWEQGSRDVFRNVPWGMRKLLNWIRIEYDNPPVLITENGYAGFLNETTDDKGRQKYLKGYLNATAKALIWDKCNVLGYTSWSLMDNYEWTDGYTMRFGLYYVDFGKADKPRVPKDSVFVYKNIIQTRLVT